MVEEHIHKLLFEHDCVIIPDFGGLITHYAPARIHPVKNTLAPPSRRIAFNEKLKLNDGLLISTLAYDRKLTTEAAQKEVNNYVRYVQNSLFENHQHELKGIGLFRYNAAQKLEFDYIPADNFLNDSFGLPELISRPLETGHPNNNLRGLLQEKKNAHPAPITNLTWRSRLRKVYDTAAVMVIAGLSATALYVLSLQNEYSQSSLNPFAVLNIAANTVAPKPATLEEGMAHSYAEEAAFNDQTYENTNQVAKVNPQPTGIIAPEQQAAFKTEAAPLTNNTVGPELPTEHKNIVGKVNEAEIKEKESKALVVAPSTVEAPVKKLGINIKKATERYYVIAGGYSTLPKAEYSRKVAIRFGAQGRVIHPFSDSKLYRVSVADFGTKEEALVYLPKLKINYGKNIWILKY